MLLNNFYTLLSSESTDASSWIFRVELNPEHAVYQGHFPEHPVVPGVFLLQLIKECAENIYQQKLQYIQVSSCKFLSAVNPAKTPYLSVTLTLKDAEEDKIQLQAEGTVEDECFIKLKALFTPIKV